MFGGMLLIKMSVSAFIYYALTKKGRTGAQIKALNKNTTYEMEPITAACK